MRKPGERFFYHLFKSLFSLGLRIYYKNISCSGVKNVEIDSPIVTASNHPTGLMDVFLSGYFIKRQVKFTAAGALFNNKLQAAFLTIVGTIPVYRRKDTPGEMDKNVDSFEHCFQELEAGGAIGFYPEGTSHPEPWVNPIKTGAARVALQAEDRNDFTLNLKLVPIGINSLYPGVFRGSAFVNIGKPISSKKYKDLYRENSYAAAEKLTTEIQQAMEACTFHVTDNLLLNFIEDLKIIGFHEIKVKDQKASGKAAKFYSITKALEHKVNHENKSFEKIAPKASELKSNLQKHGIKNQPFEGITTVFKFISLFLLSLIGLPAAIVGTIANILPFISAKKLGRKLAGKDISLIPAARLMMGVVIFLLYHLLLFIIAGCFIGFDKSIVISLLFLLCGYLTLWYWEALKALILISRKIYLWITDKKTVNELLEQREEIISELNELLE